MIPQKRALVVGGTGPTGPHVVNGLLARGWEVTLFHRGTHETDQVPAHVEHVHGDPHFAETIAQAMGTREFELVVAMYGRTRLLARHFQGRAGRFIAIGTWAAYRGHGVPGAMFPQGIAIPAREEDPTAQSEADGSFYWKIAQTERDVLALHPAGTVLRYPLVYGPRQLRPREWSLVRRALDKRPFVILPDNGLQVLARGAAENMAHAVLCTVDHPREAAGQVYNCADERQFTWRQVAELVARAVGHEWEIVSLPASLAVPSWPMINPHEGAWHRLVDIGKSRRELGYRDVVPAAQALTDTVTWCAENRASIAAEIERRLEDPFDYAAEDRLAHAWRRTSAALLQEHGREFHRRPHSYPHPTTAGQSTDHRGR